MMLRLLTPIPAIILGAYAAHRAGVSLLAFVPNLIGVILGVPLAVWLRTRRKILFENHLTVSALTVIGTIAGTLLFPDMESVHRWLQIGPFNINASMALAPFIVCMLSISLRCQQLSVAYVAAALLIIHAIQPDAGQQTAYCAASIVLFLAIRPIKPVLRYGGILLMVVATIYSWSRIDSLPAVEHVELIIHLVFKAGVIMSGAFWLFLMLLFLPLLLDLRTSYRSKCLNENAFVMASIVYGLVSFAVTELGNFPVPVFGAGISSVLGWYVILGLNQLSPES